jgi:hypothetical protein
LVEISMLIMKVRNRISNLYSHYTTTPLVINSCTHELISPRRLILASAIRNTSKNTEEAIRIADE